jgi:hypothetical protein
MNGQRLTIRIIEAEHLRVQRLSRYRYEVMSRGSASRGCVDVAYSEDPMMRAGHTYIVTMGREQGNPRIVRCHRESRAGLQPSDSTD